MTEPTPEAYEAATREYDVETTGRVYFEIIDGHQDGIAAVVEAVWPIAVAEGRRQAAEAIRAQIVAGVLPPLAAGARPTATTLAEWAAWVAEDTPGGDE